MMTLNTIFVFMIYHTAAYQMYCPVPSEWYLRSKAVCEDYHHYTCLFDETINSFNESCSVKFDFQRPGYRVTLRTNIHAKACQDDLYQPFIFFTNTSSDCELQRSFCNEDGQIVSSNGTIKTDRQCRCNYAQGYTYVTKPRNICSCIPAVEDCSCYLKKCLNDNNILSPDYKCIDQFSWSGKFLCSSISDLRKPISTVPRNTILLRTEQDGFSRDTDVRLLLISTVLLLIIFYIIILMKDDIRDIGVNIMELSSTAVKVRTISKRHIKANYYDIITTIDYEAVTNYLIRKNILNVADLRNISGKGLRRKDKNQELLQKLWRVNHAWIDHFMHALRVNGYLELVNRIYETDIDTLEEYGGDLSDDDDGNKNIPRYNRELNTRYIKDWLDEDKSFSSTTIQLEEIIKQKNCILLVGDSGQGKTSLIRHIAVKLWREDDYDIVPIVTVPLIIRNFYNVDRKQVFVVDDFCGRDSIYETSVDLWVLPHYTKLFENIIESNTKRKDVKILMACNSAVYDDPLFNSLAFYKQYTVSLSNWPLKDIKTQRMFKSHFSPADIEGSVRDFQLKGFSFPLLCKLSRGKPPDQISRFFEKPFESIKQDICKIKEQGDFEFYLICLFALLDNQFSIDWLDAKTLPEKKRKSIEGTAKLFSHLHVQDEIPRDQIKKTLENLEKSYVVKTNQTYSIVHEKIYEIAAGTCGDVNFCHFIENASSKFIANRYRLKEINHNEPDEMEMFINITLEKEMMYFKRLIDDLRNGETYSCLHNKQLKYRIYREKFLKYCRRGEEPAKIKQILASFKEKDKNTSTLKYKDYERDSYYTDLKKQCSYHITTIGIPLIESVIEGFDDIVEFLLEMGCNINATHSFGRSSLYIAALLNHKQIVSLLIEKNADTSIRDHRGRSALYISCRKGHDQIVKDLLETNQNISQYDDKKKTPLHAASKKGHAHVVKILLDKQHCIDPLDNQHHTPLFFASGRGHSETVRTLIQEGSDIYIKDKNGWTPLFAACKSGRKAVAEILMDKKAVISECDVDGRSPLLIAASNGRHEVVKLLLQRNADKKQCDSKSRSALYLACKGGHKTTVHVLLQNACCVNACNKKGKSPLHVACGKRNVEIVNALLSQNDSIEALEIQNRSVSLDYHEKGNTPTMEALLDTKININITDADGDSPLHVACKRGDKEIAKILVLNGADINHSNNSGRQPLHITCSEGHYEIVDMLLQRNAETNYQDVEGATPLIAACKSGQAKIIRLLLEHNATVQVSDNKKRSPLHFASIKGLSGIVQALLDKAPHIISEKDNEGKIALDLARENKHSNIVELLSLKTITNY